MGENLGVLQVSISVRRCRRGCIGAMVPAVAKGLICLASGTRESFISSHQNCYNCLVSDSQKHPEMWFMGA
jgi:hypothetical protein